MLHTVEIIFVIEYLNKIETEFENTLACLSGARWVQIMKKTGGQKSCDKLPLMLLSYKIWHVILQTNIYYYNKKSKKSPSAFVFGMTGDSFSHKNHILLTELIINFLQQLFSFLSNNLFLIYRYNKVTLKLNNSSNCLSFFRNKTM